jgi:hypothetical protein
MDLRLLRTGTAMPWFIRGGLLAAAGAVVALIIVTALLGCSVQPTHLEVQNDSGEHVVLGLGTLTVVDVPPHATRTMTNRGSKAPLYVQSGAPYKECGWDEARERQPLIIDAAGAHCRDTRSDYPPYPTPVPP